jgi:hypothetical protein
MKNPYTAITHHPAKERSHLCYPKGDAEGLARVCFFINKRIDQTMIDLTDDQQCQEWLIIHNVYNPPETSSNRQSTLPQIREALKKYHTDEQALLGDFNLHHPLMGGLNSEATDLECEDVIVIIRDFALHNTLPPGMVTYEEGEA